ncbi:hypothetical protein F5Y03DRAFT_406456 [Xylaria venustula]|nr:hypothetical protein F5Y03DRAFT_406456 [Xylaria venustula]
MRNVTASGRPCQYSLILPALRPRLDREPVPPGKILTPFEETNDVDYETFDPFAITVPETCETDSNSDYYPPYNVTHPDWVGAFTEVGTGIKISRQKVLVLRNSSLPGTYPIFPSIVVAFGAHLGARLHKTDFTVLACNQMIQRVNTVVKFTHRSQDKGLLGSSNLPQAPIIQKSESDALVHGPNITALEGLPAPNQAEKLKRAVSGFYTNFMVVVMNSDPFRWPAQTGNSSTEKEKFNETVTFEVSRLAVDFTSKLTLQIMLATTVALSGLAFWLGELRGMLSRNPCSIASVMVLLTDSQICNREFIPVGSEWKSERELAEVFKTYDVKLGW